MNFDGFVTVLWSDEDDMPIYIFSDEGKVIMKGNSTDNSDFRSFAEGFATAKGIRTKFIKVTNQDQLKLFEGLVDSEDMDTWAAES